jgi:hypothetical protein
MPPFTSRIAILTVFRPEVDKLARSHRLYIYSYTRSPLQSGWYRSLGDTDTLGDTGVFGGTGGPRARFEFLEDAGAARASRISDFPGMSTARGSLNTQLQPHSILARTTTLHGRQSGRSSKLGGFVQTSLFSGAVSSHRTCGMVSGLHCCSMGFPDAGPDTVAEDGCKVLKWREYAISAFAIACKEEGVFMVVEACRIGCGGLVVEWEVEGKL